MLELSNVRITNGKDKDAFHVLVRHLSVNDGGVAVISGPSGSGKSIAPPGRGPHNAPGS